MGDFNSSRLAQQIKSDPMHYMSELTSKSSVTLDEFLTARRSMQNCADETNTQLKKKVYKNYPLFIETSKEISYMKSEMSQLYRLLNEQHKTMEQMLNISIGGSKTGLTASEKKEALEKVKEERERKMLQMSQATVNGVLPSREFRCLVDSIEGGAGMLDTRLSSLIYFEGEVIELDEDYQEIQHLYLVLLNDSLIICTLLANRHKNLVVGGKKLNQVAPAPMSNPNRKYKFQLMIDLETIAVVNVKDRRYSKFEMAFKILMTSTTKVFLTSAPALKVTWIEAFEAAKKYRRTHRLQRRDTLYLSNSPNHNSLLSASPSVQFEQMGGSSGAGAPTSGQVAYSPALNPFEEPEMEQNSESDPELPTWLVELPDDLDVYIAQRNFDDAVKLVNRAHEHFFLYPKWCDNQMQVDLKLKIDNKISELVDALSSELNVAPDRSMQTGPRASRRAVSQLVRLGKTSLAIHLFLEQRTRLLKYNFKQQKGTDGATLTFMKRMTTLFFSQITETSKEFLRAFELVESQLGDEQFQSDSGHWLARRNSEDLASSGAEHDLASGPSSTTPFTSQHTALAALNAWNYQQFTYYLGLFPRHVFINQVNLLAQSECVSLAISHCRRLRQLLGIDFMFVLSRDLKNEITRLIEEIKDKFLEAVRLRANEDRFQEQRFESRAKLNKFVSEMKELGLDVGDWVSEASNEGATVALTFNATTFAKSYLNTSKDLLKLAHNPYSIRLISDSLVLCLKSQLKYLASCMESGNNRELIRHNMVFILEQLVPVIIRQYCETFALRSFNDLQNLAARFSYVKESWQSTPTRYRATPTSSRTPGDTPQGSPVPAPRARKSQLPTGVNSPRHQQSNGSEPNYSMATYL